MTKTEKYQLPQWELSDRILMEDFNEAMSNIDKGMDGIRTEAATNLAAQAADTAAKIGSGGKTCRIATGTYVGNGGESPPGGQGRLQAVCGVCGPERRGLAEPYLNPPVFQKL